MVRAWHLGVRREGRRGFVGRGGSTHRWVSRHIVNAKLNRQVCARLCVASFFLLLLQPTGGGTKPLVSLARNLDDAGAMAYGFPTPPLPPRDFSHP